MEDFSRLMKWGQLSQYCQRKKAHKELCLLTVGVTASPVPQVTSLHKSDGSRWRDAPEKEGEREKEKGGGGAERGGSRKSRRSRGRRRG